MEVLIDGDAVAYPCSAVGQHMEYKGYGEQFRYKREWDAYCKENGLDKNEVERVVVVDEPVENCLHSAKLVMNRILSDTSADSYRVFLGGKTNYRKDLYPEYKAHRQPVPPVHLEDLREYLFSNWDAELVEGVEVDDMLGIMQTEYMAQDIECCIAATDKDLDMIPGWRYNIMKQEGPYWIDEDAAIYAFYKQLLMGDSTDNIPGLVGCGPKMAERALKDKHTPMEMYQACVEKYKLVYPEDWMDHLTLNANLLWIQREAGALWQPPVDVEAEA